MTVVDTSGYSAADRAAVRDWLAGAFGRAGAASDTVLWPVSKGIPAAFGAGSSTTVDVSTLTALHKAQMARQLRAFAVDVQPPQFAGAVRQLATDVEAA